jgi:hypothetical protein
MNIKNKLREAIGDGDWGGVVDFYQNMFGEEVEAPDVKAKPEENLNGIRSLLQDALALTGHSDFKNKSVEARFEKEDNKQPSDIKFISSSEYNLPEDDDENYAEAVKDHNKKRTRSVREEYKPNISNCKSCGAEFDVNKEYPVGTIDSSRGLKCNRCRTAS